jgi:molecular chaperone DnaK (HSP70)
MQQTLFAFDCGATNWRLYRVSYQSDGPTVRMLGEPQPSPLTSFVERRLPTVILLSPDGTTLESFGDVAQHQLEDEKLRERIRDYFKPCIGAHLEKAPLSHQKRYTHTEALRFTQLLLQAILDQLRREKWRAHSFDERVRFAFAYPVHWRDEHEGQILKEFKRTVLDCFAEEFHDQVRFVSEPEAAILSLQRQGLLAGPGKGITLVADVGGSTTDLVAGWADPRTGELEQLRRYGEPHGGGLYDAEVAKFIADELKIPASALADDPSAMISLRIFGRKIKEALSRQLLRPGDSFHPPQRTITLVMRSGEIFRRRVKLDEVTFQGVARHLIADFEYLMENGLKVMGLGESEIGQVALVGGGVQLYTIVRHLRRRFGEQKVVLSDNPAETVVQGVALEYGKALETPQPSYRFSQTSSVPERRGRLITGAGEVFPLQAGVTPIGRKRTNAIWLKDDQASRFHAEIREGKDGLTIIDLGSTNGTFVNGAQLAANRPYLLHPGDEIKIGDTRLRLAE